MRDQPSDQSLRLGLKKPQGIAGRAGEESPRGEEPGKPRIAPQAGIRPSWTSGLPICSGTGEASATRNRQAKASSSPPPRQTP